ncbi:unnamed protein product [Rhizophagus irregularis]|nr:unnamed protein product [Rhizophagus irregularis]
MIRYIVLFAISRFAVERCSSLQYLLLEIDEQAQLLLSCQLELPGLRNGRLRREGTSWTSKWTLETRRNAS